MFKVQVKLMNQVFSLTRSTFVIRSPNFSDMKYSFDTNPNNGSYTLNRSNGLSTTNRTTSTNNRSHHESIEMPIIRTNQTTNLNETKSGPSSLSVIAEQLTSSSSSSEEDNVNTNVVQKSKQMHHSFTYLKNTNHNQHEQVINHSKNRLILTSHNLQRKKF